MKERIRRFASELEIDDMGSWMYRTTAPKRKAMLRDPNFWRLYQAGFIGPQYFCFTCMNVCPVGRKATA